MQNLKTEEEAASVQANPPTPINNEKISIEKEAVETDGTAKEKVKRKRKIKPPREKKN